jgi:glyoxylase-like metal-dependent hydrolase (beta-lactamase superfamily II)
MRTLVRGLETQIDGLYATPPQAFPFARSLYARAFLLERDGGNLLVYSVIGLSGAARALEELGGVVRQYLGHRHEAAFLTDAIDTPLFLHEAEYDAVDVRARPPWTFSREHVLDGDFQVLPTPGHTPGATTYLWDSGRHRVLFTGDTIYVRDGEWVAALLASSDREAYIASLEVIRALDFDVLVPWIAPADQPYHEVADRADAQRRIDAIIRRLRAGGDH